MSSKMLPTSDCKVSTLLAVSVALVATATPLARAMELEWIRQLGGPESDQGLGVAVNQFGDVFLSGRTSSDLGGPHAGNSDAFISKYDALGNQIWTRQLGSAEIDIGYDVSADPLGHVFVAGTTWGSLGGLLQGSPDAFLSKYDSDGALHWVRHLGDDITDARGVAADGMGNAYIAGWVRGDLGGGVDRSPIDAFVAKYDDAGSRLWYRQISAPAQEVLGTDVAVGPDGSVYMSGYTRGAVQGVNAGSRDAFLVKYSASGARLWTRQFGTPSSDRGESVAADGLGNVFVVGDTEGDLGGPNAGGPDVFVRKYDATGNLLWTTQFGSGNFEEDLSAAADGLGNVYVSGLTWGSLGGPTAGGHDAFLSKLDSSGNLLWLTQLGTAGSDAASGVGVGVPGKVFIAGSTGRNLGAPNAGGTDAFLVKYSDAPVPEPSGAATLIAAAIVVVARSSRRNFLSTLSQNEARTGR